MYLPVSKDMNLSTEQNLISLEKLQALNFLCSFQFLLGNALACFVKMDLIDFFDFSFFLLFFFLPMPLCIQIRYSIYRLFSK